MSYTTLFQIDRKTGLPLQHKEYRNSWGWCAFVWDVLVKKYGIIERLRADKEYNSERWKPEEMKAWEYLWKLHEEGEVRFRNWEHNVLVCTYDRMMVKEDDLLTLDQSLRMFDEAHGTANRVNHTKAMAADIHELFVKHQTLGICWWGNSVSDDPWSEWDEEAGKSIDYNFLDGDDHHVADIKNPFEGRGHALIRL